ncbi:hypothetical protein Moror_5038 [Moniliophthora roreri MCA 2997]|uniref:Uncharacterized protein n=2 Tax=Moniliophthora roreri TaxID=221103 RepID=V2X0M3_MONRO|nr:hypothetical protein Moror_5038 [Moniliophthora roreri MCA 2997]
MLSETRLLRLLSQQNYASAYRYLLALKASPSITHITPKEDYIHPVLHTLPHLPNSFNNQVFFDWLALLPSFHHLLHRKPQHIRKYAWAHPAFAKHLYKEGDPTTLIPVTTKWAVVGAEKGYLRNFWPGYWAWLVRLVSESSGVQLGIQVIHGAVEYECSGNPPYNAKMRKELLGLEKVLSPSGLSPSVRRIMDVYMPLLQGCKLAGPKWEAELVKQLVKRVGECDRSEENIAVQKVLERLKEQW